MLTPWQSKSIVDTTQSELREVDSTGTVTGGEKVLKELRKRKLISEKLVAPLLGRCTGSSSMRQEGSVVLRGERTELQYLAGEA